MKTLLATALMLALTTTAHAETQPAQTDQAPGSILVQNKYYPKPGQADAVLATRLEASAVRQRLGLQVGTVYVRVSQDTGGPYVIWECEYPTIEARTADAAAAEGTPEFAAVQAKMRGLIDRFERATWDRRD
ncbi:hypothetical protein GRI97_09960 [Altererythrobacter xixiisoli]|uniref:Uncharacterized protein n=1 Tax=Croceibacterium xixiisoli TaxID=1476466 RepID=A0A6I4TY67_9SPHN|nr:hypothetical protein [Croceibacterium xixiisoli]MXO99313.1 hypothetical protein [Croceibacterium xixiisoli]